jgi:hypothetical protein
LIGRSVLAEDLPSWHVCSRDAINPVNGAVPQLRALKALGLEVYHVAPIWPRATGSVRR